MTRVFICGPFRRLTSWRASRRQQAQAQRDLARILARFVAFPGADPEPRAGHVSHWSVRYWTRRMERER